MTRKRYVTVDGLRLLVGGRAWRWYIKNKKALEGSNPPITKPPAHTPVAQEIQVVAFCHTGLAHAGKMIYTESSLRSQLFHRPPGHFDGAHADCSQFCSSILHWCGVKKVTDSDYTGTLLQKGTEEKTPAPGLVVIFGGGTGEHAAFITEHASQKWWTVGFGHQGGPDRVSLPDMEAYFKSTGHPGVRFLKFV